MNSNKTPAPKKKRKGLRIALCALCLSGLIGYLSYFIAFHQTFDPYLTEEVQKQVVRRTSLADLTNAQDFKYGKGDIHVDGEKIYDYSFQDGKQGALLSLFDWSKNFETYYQAQWNGETEASEFHFKDGDSFEKTFRILTYKELLATFISFTLDPDQFSYQSRMKNLSFDRKENYVETTAAYLPEEDWAFSLPRMGVTYSLSKPIFEFNFHPMDEYLAGNGGFWFIATGDCEGKKVEIYVDFYLGDVLKTLDVKKKANVRALCRNPFQTLEKCLSRI